MGSPSSLRSSETTHVVLLLHLAVKLHVSEDVVVCVIVWHCTSLPTFSTSSGVVLLVSGDPHFFSPWFSLASLIVRGLWLHCTGVVCVSRRGWRRSRCRFLGFQGSDSPSPRGHALLHLRRSLLNVLFVERESTTFPSNSHNSQVLLRRTAEEVVAEELLRAVLVHPDVFLPVVHTGEPAVRTRPECQCVWGLWKKIWAGKYVGLFGGR